MKTRYLTPRFVPFAALSSAALAVEYLPDRAGVISAMGQKDFLPYGGREFPTRVLWGDTHLHTAVSVDAGTMCRLGQEDAFRFARGEEVRTTHGLRAKLSRPLDFIVVSDHAEMYGLMPQLPKGGPRDSGHRKGQALVRHVERW